MTGKSNPYSGYTSTAHCGAGMKVSKIVSDITVKNVTFTESEIIINRDGENIPLLGLLELVVNHLMKTADLKVETVALILAGKTDNEKLLANYLKKRLLK
jgi:hypothetical protein